MAKVNGVNVRDLAKGRLAAIKKEQSRGGLGPFAPSPQPKNDEKISPLNARRAAQFKDRKEQEAHFGLTRGRNAGYTGD